MIAYRNGSSGAKLLNPLLASRVQYSNTFALRCTSLLPIFDTGSPTNSWCHLLPSIPFSPLNRGMATHDSSSKTLYTWFDLHNTERAVIGLLLHKQDSQNQEQLLSFPSQLDSVAIFDVVHGHNSSMADQNPMDTNTYSDSSSS